MGNSTQVMSAPPAPELTFTSDLGRGVLFPVQPISYQGYISRTDNNEVLCAATIISSLVILTTAHCLEGKNASSLNFVAGDKRRSTSDGREQKRKLASIHIHEGFDTEMTSLEHDIAVAVLSYGLNINDYVKIAEVANNPASYYGTGTISGWGKSHDTGIFGDDVQASTVSLVNRTQCISHWNQYLNITEDYICAYVKGVAPCSGFSGDGGGGLLGVVNGNVTVVGVIAGGQGCDDDANDDLKPDISINVSKYGSWIRAKIQVASFEEGMLFYLRAAQCASVGKFLCSPISGKCTSNSYVCDGDNDCGNNEDEANCNLHKKRSQCSRDQMWCRSCSKCISNTLICDGANDCGNNDDEVNCKRFGKQTKCSPHQFWCKGSSKCLTINYVCDGDNDCGDNEDEKFCTFH